MKRVLLLASALVLLVNCKTASRTWHIASDGTGDAPTIQAGIDSAAAGDTVALTSTSYSGAGNRNVDFLGKAITLRADNGTGYNSTIDCGGVERGLIFQSGEGSASTVENVSVYNARADTGFAVLCANGSSPTFVNCSFDGCVDYSASPSRGGGMACIEASSPQILGSYFYQNSAAYGAGLYCESSSPSLEDVEFIDNYGLSGAGLYCVGGSPQLLDCRFPGNYAADSGGAAYFYNCSPTLINCNLRNQEASWGGGAIWCGAGSIDCLLTIRGCSFCENKGGMSGGAIHCVGGDGHCDLYLENCTIAQNEAWLNGSGVSLVGNSSSRLENTIIAFNLGPEGLYCEEQNVPALTCCDIYANEGGDWVGGIADQYGLGGNFSADPLFCGAYGYLYCNLVVEDCSPCLPGNHPDGYDCGDNIGACGPGCACGTATEPTTWGAIKSMYK